MTAFDEYARYYDLVYREKPYETEVAYILDLAARHGVATPSSVLELGVGTGAHAQHFLAKGLTVHGVDMSERMLDQAARRRERLPSEHAARFTFSLGDVRTAKLGEQFDLVVSLFHVMSYQLQNEDVIAAFQTARQHLKPDGVFIFDCWHGPGVLTEPPEVRVKELEDDTISAIRIATPKLHSDTNSVDVNYSIRIRNKETDQVTEFAEVHCMRYFFQPELRHYLQLAGLELMAGYRWMGYTPPDRADWLSCFVAAPVK
jgi:SAM-dependent methyltransferase